MKQIVLLDAFPLSPKRAGSVGQSSIPAPKITSVKQEDMWWILIDLGPNDVTDIINKKK